MKTSWEKAFLALKDAVGWGGIVVIGIIVLVVATISNMPRKKSQSLS